MPLASIFDARTAAFAGLVAVLVVTPGLNTAVITRLVLERGRASALWGVTGVAAGTVAQSLAAAGGLSAALLASPGVFRAVQICGIGYVLLLGVRALVACVRPMPAPATAGRPVPIGGAFRTGLFTSLLNPTLALFYLTVVPQFISPGDRVMVRALSLALVHISISMTWLSAYAVSLHAIVDVLERPRVRVSLDALTGCALVLIAVRLAFRAR